MAAAMLNLPAKRYVPIAGHTITYPGEASKPTPEPAKDVQVILEVDEAANVPLRNRALKYAGAIGRATLLTERL